MSTKKKLLEAAAGNAGEAVYVEDVFSTYLYEGTNGAGPEASIDNLTTNTSPSGGLACDNAGTAIAAVDGTTYEIKSAILSTPYDITSAGTTLSFDPTATTARVDGIRFNPTGSKLYATNAATDTIYQFSLSTAFDVSTASYDSVSLDMSTEMASSGPRGMAFSADGTTLAVVGAGPADGIYRYTLTTGFDLSTASYEDFFSTATQANNPYNMEFNGDGTKMFVLQGTFANPSGMPLYQYSLSTAYDTSTASYDSVFQYIIGIAPPNHTGIYGMAFWRDGTGLVATSFPGTSGTPSQTTSASFLSYDITTINGTTRINNDIDINGEGGMVWIKGRSNTSYVTAFDTERGADKYLIAGLANAEASSTAGTRLTAFNSDGFSLGTDPGSALNFDGYTYASWTFRKQPGFFDVVTYTGTGSAQAISHNLGTTPGMIIVKNLTDAATNWTVYHRGSNGGTNPEQYSLLLNEPNAQAAVSIDWNDTAPTATQFTVGTNNRTNGSGDSLVAYLFAHDAQDFGTGSDEAIIKCGTVTFGVSGDVEVDLGFEPQWVLYKRVDSGGNWWMLDNMRGWEAQRAGGTFSSTTGGKAEAVWADLSNAETEYDYGSILQSGFKLPSNFNAGTGTTQYIYVAIRRPNKPSSKFTAADLFDTVLGQTSGTPNYDSSTGVVDALFRYVKTSDPGYPTLAGRLSAHWYMETSSAPAESQYPVSKNHFAVQNGWGDAIGGTSTNAGVHMFRRAPGFFDSVAYIGNASTRTINHSLGVTPEMMIIKCRTNTNGWVVYHSAVGNTGVVILQSTGATITNSLFFNDTSPTDTVFTVGAGGAVNENNIPIISYLFATAPGISKVGSYTGTGSDVNVDCGFSSGSRFVLVKRTDSTGGWYLWDSENGIIAGNDPFMLLNSSTGQTTGTDYIDPLSSGFTITSTAPAELNASGGTYIFLAIA